MFCSFSGMSILLLLCLVPSVFLYHKCLFRGCQLSRRATRPPASKQASTSSNLSKTTSREAQKSSPVDKDRPLLCRRGFYSLEITHLVICFTGYTRSADKRNVGALSPLRESGRDYEEQEASPPLYVSCLSMPYSALDRSGFTSHFAQHGTEPI